MEESSRSLLQQKHRAEQLKQEKTALTLSYEGLREEIGALQRRIRELEAQNRALSGILAQAASPGSPTELIQGILEAGPAALVAALGLDPSWVPLSRPRSLNLQIPVMAATKCRRNRPLGINLSL
ncbi:oral-facial-digital syndrome 1-like protein [Lasius niger]|uniref:Oral-facial-digital syndrome 1-like protein n=1 Tax=Lasius niger TaxID=67767 RepID=A0A0J7L3M6_LASNI|nr:oral-facial-digital syndrome 1-like protein [Lasius niger]